MRYEKIRLILNFLVHEKIYEVYFSQNLSLKTSIYLLIKLLKEECLKGYLNNNFIVYEKHSNICLDSNIILRNLDLEEGSILIVY